MKMRFRSRQFGWIFRLLGLLIASTLFIASTPSPSASAQSTDDTWAAPLNLSHSGVATNPAIVSDSEGGVHVVWQDDIGAYVYTRFDGDQWSEPERTGLDRLFELPIPGEPTSPTQLEIYTGANPLFIAAPSQFIFSFWISPEGKLFTSKVRNLSFEKVAAWDSERLITQGAGSFSAAIDARGELHLAFFRMADDAVNPAGIYYTQSKNSGLSWAVPVLLYESPYIRTLSEGEAEISLATAMNENEVQVYIAWDNRPRKQVLLAQSSDGGENWEQPVLISGPAPGSGLAGPLNIHVGANQNNVVLVWQSGWLGGACRQIYQSSNDGGANWSDPRPMIENLLGCAQSNKFLTEFADSPKDSLYFLTETQSQVFLTVWNGLEWSQQEAQPILSGFEDPEIFTQVDFGCHQSSLSGERLYFVGCDQGGGGDVWVTSRDLMSNSSQFVSPVWSQPSPVTDDRLNMEAVELVASDDSLIHAFFSQYQDPSIYYTYWDGKLWSRITLALELPEGEAAWPAIAAGSENELFLIARNDRGMLYFSRAASGVAATSSSWSTPTRLGLGHDGKIGSVDVASDATGTVYVAYSVPVNQERGIYLVQSNDQGTTWSEPLQVFNGAEAGFDLVGAPSLLASENGFLHITWKQQSIQGDGVPQPLSLYYTRSENGGRTFSDAELVVEEAVAWREIVADGEGNLHLLWQPQDTLIPIWDQVSLDDGRSWQFPQGLPGEETTVAVMVDSIGQLHLVGAGSGSLGYWIWDGSRWQPETPLHWSLDSQKENPVKLLAATVNHQGKMVVALAVPTGAGDATASLLYSTRTIELPPTQTTVKEVPTQMLLSPTLISVTPTADHSATSTVDSDPANSQAQTDETNDPISPFTIALVPVALLLLIVVGIVIRRIARGNDR